MTIRTAAPEDLQIITALERECFPEAEAASEKSIKERLNAFPDHFRLLFAEDHLVSFVNGMLTDEEDLRDEMYTDTSLHDNNGKWLMIFGVATAKEYRGRGYAGLVVNSMLEQLRQEHRAGAVLTCKESLVGFYEKLGFANEGVSGSVHGGAKWYQMRIVFRNT